MSIDRKRRASKGTQITQEKLFNVPIGQVYLCTFIPVLVRQMSRLNVDGYRRRAGDQNAEKLRSSQEVLHLSQSEEDVDVDVEDKKDI